MQIISNDLIRMHITEKGTISYLKYNDIEFDLFIPIYFLVLEKHSFENPICRHLDDSSDILAVEIEDSKIKFIKKFEDTRIDISISISDAVYISVDFSGEINNRLFGVVFPLFSDISKNNGEEIIRSLCSYDRSKSSVSIENIQGLISPEIDNYYKNIVIKISSETDDNCEFFFHNQIKKPCMRITGAKRIKLQISKSVEENKKEIDYRNIIKEIDRQVETCKLGVMEVDKIMDLIRTCRHPGGLWEQDLLFPKKEMKQVVLLVKEFESIVCDNAELKKGYTADINQQSAFINVRCHILSEENNIQGAISIYEQFEVRHFDELNACRKSCLLFSMSTAYLSNMDFGKSISYYFRLSDLMLYSDRSSRFAHGISDSFNILTMIYWFFMKNSIVFREHFAKRLGISDKELWKHKKTYFGILNDPLWVACHMGMGFYSHAAEKYNLQKVEI